MPIILGTPVTVPITKDGIIFCVDSVSFKFNTKEATFFWCIKNQDGKTITQGAAQLAGEDFTNWYNLQYASQQDLVTKAAYLANFNGQYTADELV